MNIIITMGVDNQVEVSRSEWTLFCPGNPELGSSWPLSKNDNGFKWPYARGYSMRNALGRMEELSWSQDRKNALNNKKNRKNRKVANLIFGYVFLPLAVCFFVLILKLFLLSSVSFKLAETWIFQTLLDHWLECCLLSVINLNFLIRFKRDKN